MVSYSPEDVSLLIKLLKKAKPKNEKEKAARKKMIFYQDQRRSFFNPNKEMLVYIIEHANNLGVDPKLLEKLKAHLAGGEYRAH